MSTHYAVIESVTGQPSESVYAEVCNTSGTTVTFTLRNASGGQVATFDVAPNANHFVTSGNLFAYTTNATAALVVTCTVDTSVILRHTVTSLTNSVTRAVAVPKSTDALATTIVFPTGSIGSGAHAMVFNPNTTSISVALRYGTAASTPVSYTTVPTNGYAFISIATANACAILSSSSAFTAQYLVKQDTNPFTESYEVP